MDTNTEAQVSTQMDDASAEVGQTESELLDAVLSNSQFMQNEEPLPGEEVPELDPGEESEVEDPEEDSEPDHDEDYEEDGEVEEDVEDDAEEASTDDVFVPLEDLDLELRTEVTIDGEQVEVSLAELVKGYATEQSLSKKGRELGETRKEIEAERDKRLSELNGVAQAAAEILVSEEATYQQEYHSLEKEIDKAREEDDTYELTKLKDKQQIAQRKYWEVRRRREGMLEKVSEQQEQQAVENWNRQVDAFNQVITEYIPNFDQETATSIRDFALEEGLPEEVIDSVIDPRAIKILHDYMQLKKGVSKGTARRRAAPTKKAPVKKAKSTATKQQERADAVRNKAFSDDASSDDQMAFLKQYAQNTLNNL